MGRKKKKPPKPWCWYCNREFEDEKILVQHQKAKHFKCHICHKKLFTGPGLAIHCMQVHKETVDKVPNSIPSRSSVEIEIYGMEGIPDEDLKARQSALMGEEPEKKRMRMDGMNPYMMPIPTGPIAGTIIPPPLPVATPPVPISKPLFPAATETPTADVPQIVTATANSKIVHPTDDISLEERKSQQRKYAKAPPPALPPPGIAPLPPSFVPGAPNGNPGYGMPPQMMVGGYGMMPGNPYMGMMMPNQGRSSSENYNVNSDTSVEESKTRVVKNTRGNREMASPEDMYYSDKYTDEYYEYRHVILRKEDGAKVPRNHRLTETEWRNLGVRQSPGWEHYIFHEPEPYILCFRRPLEK
ncbi:unnamed protein product [Notodromas monacha]|uniref:Cyclin-dependent kinases regulatory subunit n=1 Tax=Notodromas monacha TaxID=399045 RepID=A0A7R9BMH7_9CRUS|nr:unnamed protein product [Notodromas monacha]CAG0916732.1 unnamed protein product [Notodromas monacha]